HCVDDTYSWSDGMSAFLSLINNSFTDDPHVCSRLALLVTATGAYRIFWSCRPYWIQQYQTAEAARRHVSTPSSGQPHRGPTGRQPFSLATRRVLGTYPLAQG